MQFFTGKAATPCFSRKELYLRMTALPVEKGHFSFRRLRLVYGLTECLFQTGQTGVQSGFEPYDLDVRIIGERLAKLLFQDLAGNQHIHRQFLLLQTRPVQMVSATCPASVYMDFSQSCPKSAKGLIS